MGALMDRFVCPGVPSVEDWRINHGGQLERRAFGAALGLWEFSCQTFNMLTRRGADAGHDLIRRFGAGGRSCCRFLLFAFLL